MNTLKFDKEEIKASIAENVKNMYRKTIDNATQQEIYSAASSTVRDMITDKWIATHNKYYEDDVKVVYYLSMEFLMGRFFGNSVMNMMMYEEIGRAHV